MVDLKLGIPGAVQKVMQKLKEQAGKLSPELDRVRTQMSELASKIDQVKQPYSEFQNIKSSFNKMEDAAKGKTVNEGAIAQELSGSIQKLQSLPLSEPLKRALDQILSISFTGEPSGALRNYFPSRMTEWVSGVIKAARSGNTAPLKEAFGAGQAAVEVVSSYLSECKQKLTGLASKAGGMLTKEGLGGLFAAFKNIFKKG